MDFPTPIPFRELPECDDDDLVCRIEQLYKAHAKELWRKLYAKFGHRERANDAVHEAFLRLYETGMDTVEHPLSWMYRVACNFMIDQNRREKRRGGLSPSLDWVASEESLIEVLEEAEQMRLLHDVMRTLRPPDQEILRLKYAQRLPSLDIAARLKISDGAVDMRLTRARRRLENALEDRGLGVQQML